MMTLEDIGKDLKLKDSIDWEMTPAHAVSLYLEWGGSWIKGNNNFVHGKNDVSYYFIVYYWDAEPCIYFIKRNSEEAVELAKIELPKELQRSFVNSVAGNRGVYPVEDEVKQWLQSLLSLN